MGLRYRKSINVGGGFRINLSKTGIGYSWGTKGYRVTKLANGRTRRTVSIPGTGISHVTESSGNNNNNIDTDVIDTEVFENGDISNFRNNEYMELIEAIESVIKRDKKINISIIIGFVLCAIPPIGFVWIVLSIIYKLYNRKKNKIVIEYEMDDYSNDEYLKKMNCWKELSLCDSIWSVHSESKVSNSKKHGGANTVISRVKVSLSNKIPFYLNFNIKIYSLIDKNETILFMPDKIMIIRKNKIGVVSYDDIETNVERTQFIESESVPKDTIVLEEVWQYANKNGSPDKRYNNNKKLPVCEYGEINLKSSSGINIMLMSSNYSIAKNFGENFKNATC